MRAAMHPRSKKVPRKISSAILLSCQDFERISQDMTWTKHCLHLGHRTVVRDSCVLSIKPSTRGSRCVAFAIQSQAIASHLSRAHLYIERWNQLCSFGMRSSGFQRFSAKALKEFSCVFPLVAKDPGTGCRWCGGGLQLLCFRGFRLNKMLPVVAWSKA